MRLPKPFYRKQTKSWYVQINGRQTNLGPDKVAAEAAYHKLMLGRTASDPKVCDVIDLYLDWCKEHRSARTHEWYEAGLEGFRPRMRVSELRPFHITTWMAAIATAGNKYRALRSIKRAFNWALAEGYVEKSPVASIKLSVPPPREAYITPDQWKEFIALAKPGPFLDAVQFMRYSGCRPQELTAIETRHYRDGCIVFERSESKGKTEKRVIPLSKKATAIVDRLVKLYPTGPIFRTARGKPWTRTSLNTRFDHFEGKLGFKIYSYAIRHTFITDCLVAGMDPVKLSKICGHKSLAMIQGVYNHLQLRQDYLRSEVDRFTEDVA